MKKESPTNQEKCGISPDKCKFEFLSAACIEAHRSNKCVLLEEKKMRRCACWNCPFGPATCAGAPGCSISCLRLRVNDQCICE